MFYDKLNNRLIYLRSTATEEFWDQHWQNQKIDPPDLPPYLQALRGHFFGRDFVLRTTKQYLALGQSVVDGGCGLGQYVKRLSQAGYEAYGVDFAPHTIAQVTQHYPELDVRVGDVRALPFSDCFFDGYWSLGVIEHFWNGYSEIASEIHRVLKPGGYLFVNGFKSCLTNGLPVLVESRCPVVFFIPTDDIGKGYDPDREGLENFFSTSKDAYPLPVEFLSWDDCRKLSAAGMTIGSHTAGHVLLGGLEDDEARSELVRSKEKIESELKRACLHFSCPWGRSGKHFRIERDLAMAKEADYRSFFTAERGPNLTGTDQFMIRRDHMLAKWSDYQLRYFFASSAGHKNAGV